ncbi:MAG: GNAT family N-acetyltransferase [Pseudomonadota bacterium]
MKKKERPVNTNYPKINDESIEIILGDQTNLSVCCNIAGINVDEGWKRVNAGDSCFAATIGKNIIGLAWVHKGSFYIRGLGYFFRSVCDDFYIYNLIVTSEYRRRGIAKYLIRTIGDRISTKGKERVIVIVEKRNLMGLSFFNDLCFEPLQYIYHMEIFFMKYTAVKPVDKNKTTQRRLFWNQPKGVFVI